MPKSLGKRDTINSKIGCPKKIVHLEFTTSASTVLKTILSSLATQRVNLPDSKVTRYPTNKQWPEMELVFKDLIRALYNAQGVPSGKAVKLRPPQACGTRTMPSLN